MTAADTRAWTRTLVVGGAVAGVVWGLLEALRRSVIKVEQGVDEVWAAGQRVAANTQTSHLLGATSDHSAALRAALERGHDWTMEGPRA